MIMEGNFTRDLDLSKGTPVNEHNHTQTADQLQELLEKHVLVDAYRQTHPEERETTFMNKAHITRRSSRLDRIYTHKSYKINKIEHIKSTIYVANIWGAILYR
uniref:Uncharacterized protein n=1 Tax=Arion vulgaris TaxID=1028688 RepID=A0A0B7B3V9_9EUPU